MSRFAAETTVPVEKSRAEIESILSRYGASRFGYMIDTTGAAIAFEARGRRVRFELPLPAKEAYRMAPRRARDVVPRRRSDEDTHRHWEQACRQRWRALALVIKAKLEAVECGITTFEDEFLAHIVLPSGETIGQWAVPQLESVYSQGRMPPLLPASSEAQR